MQNPSVPLQKKNQNSFWNIYTNTILCQQKIDKNNSFKVDKSNFSHWDNLLILFKGLSFLWLYLLGCRSDRADCWPLHYRPAQCGTCPAVCGSSSWPRAWPLSSSPWRPWYYTTCGPAAYPHRVPDASSPNLPRKHTCKITADNSSSYSCLSQFYCINHD